MKEYESSQNVAYKALEICDPAKRVVYLDNACGGEEGLRQEVESVLATHDALGVKSASFAVRSPFGLGAKQTPLIVIVGNLFPDWEIIIAKDGEWENAKSILGIMMLAADRGARVEFFSLMPLNAWHTYIGILNVLCHTYAEQSCARQIEIIRSGISMQTLERLRTSAAGCRGKDRLFALLPQPGCPIWSGTDLAISRHLFERHSYDVLLAATPDDLPPARGLCSFLEGNGIKAYLCECSLARANDPDFCEVTELAWCLTRHVIILGSSRASFLSANIGCRHPCQYDRDWTSRCPCDLLSIRLGDLKHRDLPGVLKRVPSFAWKDNAFLKVLDHVHTKRHQTQAEMSGRDMNGMIITLGEREPHDIEGDFTSTSSGDDDTGIGMGCIALIIIALILLVGLVCLGFWMIIELST